MGRAGLGADGNALVAVGDGVAAEPLEFNPTSMFAVDGGDFHPVATGVHGVKDRFVVEGIDGVARR